MSAERDVKMLGFAQVRELAERLGVSPTKRLGQNFVIDPGTVRRIADVAGVGPGSKVLEVGPGLGSLTLALLERGAQVCAVEIDEGLAAGLPQTIEAYAPGMVDNFALVQADALQLEGLSCFEQTQGGWSPDSLVSNLPYNVAVPLILRSLAAFGSLTSALVMVQKEVADRLVARPGNRVYGAPSVKLAWFGHASNAGSVGTKVFWPEPNVTSGLVHVQVSRPYGDDERLRRNVFQVIDQAFSQRRKMLRSALRPLFRTPADLGKVLAQAGIPGTARAETLGIDDYVRLTQVALAKGALKAEDAAYGEVPEPVVASAPGKVNLHLAAGAVRADGYHPLTTIFQSLSTRDYLELRPREDDTVTVSTLVYRRVDGSFTLDEERTRAFAQDVGPGDHLAHQAVGALRARVGSTVGGADVVVHKTIPVAAGMAGGSADAAATLVAGNKLWKLGLSNDELMEVGRGLGADVPACLLGGESLGVGAGDQVQIFRRGTDFPDEGSSWWVMVQPGFGLSTAEVFQVYDQLVEEKGAAADPSAGKVVSSQRTEAETAQLADALLQDPDLRNDLQIAVLSLHPELANLGEAAIEVGAIRWVISGAGPTVAAQCASKEMAEKVGAEMGKNPQVVNVLVTWGPALGAVVEKGLPAWAQPSATSSEPF